jgi:hypothetical protein
LIARRETDHRRVVEGPHGSRNRRGRAGRVRHFGRRDAIGEPAGVPKPVPGHDKANRIRPVIAILALTAAAVLPSLAPAQAQEAGSLVLQAEIADSGNAVSLPVKDERFLKSLKPTAWRSRERARRSRLRRTRARLASTG